MFVSGFGLEKVRCGRSRVNILFYFICTGCPKKLCTFFKMLLFL